MGHVCTYLIADEVPEYDKVFNVIRLLEGIHHSVGEVPPLKEKA